MITNKNRTLIAAMSANIVAGLVNDAGNYSVSAVATQAVALAVAIVAEIERRAGPAMPLRGDRVTCPQCGAARIEVIDDEGHLEEHYSDPSGGPICRGLFPSEGDPGPGPQPDIACPECGAAPGDPCVVLTRGFRGDGTPPRRTNRVRAPHPGRSLNPKIPREG